MNADVGYFSIYIDYSTIPVTSFIKSESILPRQPMRLTRYRVECDDAAGAIATKIVYFSLDAFAANNFTSAISIQTPQISHDPTAIALPLGLTAITNEISNVFVPFNSELKMQPKFTLDCVGNDLSHILNVFLEFNYNIPAIK